MNDTFQTVNCVQQDTFSSPAEIHDEMFHVEVEIFKTRSKIKNWMRYRDVTLLEEQRAIQSLERELAYMIDNYIVLSSTLVAFGAEQLVQKVVLYVL